MNILITGSTGYIGKNLIPLLIKNKFKVLELTRDLSKSNNLYRDRTNKYLISENQEELIDCINDFKPEVVIHLASYLTALDDFNTLGIVLDSNISFTCRVLDAIKKTKIKLFINTGTFAEFSEDTLSFSPAYLYAATKTASRFITDYYSRAYDFHYNTVTPYTIYGGIDSQKKIIDIIFDSSNSLEPIDLSPGEQVLDFIHIEDVVDFYLCLLNNYKNVKNKTDFHLGTGIGVSIRELAQKIEKISGKKLNINWGGISYRPSDVMKAISSNKNLDKIKWSTNISLEEGIKKYLKSNEIKKL